MKIKREETGGGVPFSFTSSPLSESLEQAKTITANCNSYKKVYKVEYIVPMPILHKEVCNVQLWINTVLI